MSKEKEKIINTIEELQDVVDLFYQQNDQKAFEKMDVALLNVENAVDIFATYQIENPEFEIDMNKICDTLKQTMDALEKGDKVLVADILQYEFIEYLNDLSSTMQ